MMRDHGKKPIGLWAFVGATLLALWASAGLAFCSLSKNPAPRFSEERADGRREGARRPKPVRAGVGDPDRAAPERVTLAGSGSNLVLTRRLAAAFMARQRKAKAVVHRSIGSSGGIRAVRDGRIDLGLVSRPLADEEIEGGLVVIPYARVAVVVAAHPTVPKDGISEQELVELFSGRMKKWADGGRVAVLQRERGDSSHRAVRRSVEGFGSVDDEARRARRFRVLLSDRAMQQALLTTAGGVGLFDHGAIRSQNLALKELAVGGVPPSPEAVTEGRYPFYKDLAFVSAGAPEGATARFIELVFSDEGRAIIEANGYVALGAGGGRR
jgi:phosphate transport system substrate-binding protein